jgi:hypothetical protein
MFSLYNASNFKILYNGKKGLYIFEEKTEVVLCIGCF